MDFSDIDSGIVKMVQTSKAVHPDVGPYLVGVLYLYFLCLAWYSYYKSQQELEAMKKLKEVAAPELSTQTDKMNAINNTYRFFVAGQRVATGKILKDKTILQVYPYDTVTDMKFQFIPYDKPQINSKKVYLPPFKTLAEWQKAFEAASGNKIDYIEEEGRGYKWRHERIADEPPSPLKRPPFLEPVSPRTPHKVVEAEDVWESVRSNAPDAPRNADAQRNEHLKAAIEGLTKALEALKMM